MRQKKFGHYALIWTLSVVLDNKMAKFRTLCVDKKVWTLCVGLDINGCNRAHMWT